MAMVETYLMTRAPLTLKRALMIYENDREVAITEHKVDADSRILPGEPINVTAFIEGLNAKSAPTEPSIKTEVGSFVAVDERMIAENSSWRIWWTKAQKRKLFIAGKPKECWLPSLIWCGHRRQPECYLWAMAGMRKPTFSTVVYWPRFGPTTELNHIFKDSRICMGTMNPGRCTPTSWMESFYDTNFKTQDGLFPKPYEVSKTLKKLGTLASVAAAAERTPH